MCHGARNVGSQNSWKLSLYVAVGIILSDLISFIFLTLCTDGLIGLGILGGTALVVGGAAALVGLVFASRK